MMKIIRNNNARYIAFKMTKTGKMKFQKISKNIMTKKIMLKLEIIKLKQGKFHLSLLQLA